MWQVLFLWAEWPQVSGLWVVDNVDQLILDNNLVALASLVEDILGHLIPDSSLVGPESLAEWSKVFELLAVDNENLSILDSNLVELV
jgi:hypothetical protein